MDKKLDIEIGVPVANTLAGDDRVHPGTLPAGRYATLVYTGLQRGVEASKVLMDWAANNNLTWDTKKTDKGEVWGSRYESFLTDPDVEPNPDKWETGVDIRLADD